VLLLAAVSENEWGVILPAKSSTIYPRALAAPLRALDHADEFAVPRFISSDFASLAYTIGLLVVVAGIAFTFYRLFTQLISTVMLWMLFGLTLVACYSYGSDLYDVGKWLFPGAAPAHATPHRVTVTMSAQTREILQSMRKSTGQL
jgi:hypothetical protein